MTAPRGVHALDHTICEPGRGENTSILGLADALGWSRAALAAELDERPECVRVVREAEKEVAVLVTRHTPGELHVLGLAVEASFRRRGIGRALIVDLIRRARAGREEAIHLEVRSENQAALALYGGLGFEAVGRRPRYYADGEDALLMTLTLGTPVGAPLPADRS